MSDITWTQKIGVSRWHATSCATTRLPYDFCTCIISDAGGMVGTTFVSNFMLKYHFAVSLQKSGGLKWFNCKYGLISTDDF